MLQGVALGGEYGSAVVYVMEHAPADKKGAFTSVLQGTAGIGLLLALVVVSALKYFLEPQAFTQWGWRVPFLISAPIVLVATWIRMGMKETPVFVEMQRTDQLSRAPLAGDAWQPVVVEVAADRHVWRAGRDVGSRCTRH